MRALAYLVLAGAIVAPSCRIVGENETFLLPPGFNGVVFVLFDQTDGQPPKYENGRRVYEIPQNGVLKTQFQFNDGYHDLGQYFYVTNGTRVKIPFILETKGLSPDTVQACCISSGKAAKTPGGPWVEFSELFVGTKSQVHEAGIKREKLNPADFVN